jgi:hypothetical protein
MRVQSGQPRSTATAPGCGQGHKRGKLMNLEKLSKRVTEELDEALDDDLPAAEKDAILKIVQQAMLDVSSRTHRELKETAIICCGAEADLAHKIQEQMDKKREMLIANLTAMR